MEEALSRSEGAGPASSGERAWLVARTAPVRVPERTSGKMKAGCVGVRRRAVSGDHPGETTRLVSATCWRKGLLGRRWR